MDSSSDGSAGLVLDEEDDEGEGEGEVAIYVGASAGGAARDDVAAEEVIDDWDEAAVAPDKDRVIGPPPFSFPILNIFCAVEREQRTTTLQL